jgi:uncharacterized membrane protein
MSNENTPQEYKQPGNVPSDAENNKIYGILAYIGILFVVPLIAVPNSPFAKYHANQGLILFIVECAICIICSIFSWIPVLGVLVILCGSLIGLGCFVLMILGILNAANGKTEPLPLIGGFTILK